VILAKKALFKENMQRKMSQLNKRVHTPFYDWAIYVFLFSLGNCDRRLLN
jgi:hypothetical protein